MSGTSTPKSSVGNAIKIYLFPALVTVLATLIWRDVTEMRADIKALLAQSNIDKTDIQNLKKDVDKLEKAVFGQKMVTDASLPWFMSAYFKPEEQYDVKKYIPKNS